MGSLYLVASLRDDAPLGETPSPPELLAEALRTATRAHEEHNSRWTGAAYLNIRMLQIMSLPDWVDRTSLD
jgi:hypothetical protein